MDTNERAALKRNLAACPARTLTVAVLAAPVSSSPPAATPAGTAAPTGACDPNYATYCVPIVPYDLDCADIGHRVTVIGRDIHRFDNDADGIGCESYP